MSTAGPRTGSRSLRRGAGLPGPGGAAGRRGAARRSRADAAAAEATAQAVILYRQRGDLLAASAAAGRAAELASACESARTPALLAAAQPLPISERQREIAMLAAQLTNREIAARLGVSVRTVEGHIYHACIKLGLPDRAALGALFTGTPNNRP